MSSSTTTSSSSSSHEVHLAIYDLSRGMARALSGTYLGPDHALDMIPHTGLIVYGKEYFYGGGIQAVDPALFRQSYGMQPSQTQSLGRTTVSQAEFEQWCARQQASRYHPAAYDLFERNCNHFTHDAAMQGLQLSFHNNNNNNNNNVYPQWILDVPGRFLASPLGQMMRPIMEQMQIAGPTGQDMNFNTNSSYSSGGAPLSAAATSTTAVTSSSFSVTTTNTRTTTSDVNNPWANLPSTTASNDNNNNKKKDKNESIHVAPAIVKKTPILDSYHRPLLSLDHKTASFCAVRVASSVDNDEDKEALIAVGKMLDGSNHKTTTSTSSLSHQDTERCCKALLGVLQNQQDSSKKHWTFALLLLRLVVLQETTPPPRNNQDEESYSYYWQCLDWIQQQLGREDDDEDNLSNKSARSMAWCTLSNAHGSSSSPDSTFSSLELDALVEWALQDILVAADEEDHDGRRPVEVRQAAAAFLYNVALLDATKQEEGEREDLQQDRSVSMLCASLEGVQMETDAVTQLRRLLVAARIVKPVHGDGDDAAGTQVNEAAKSLVVDLGFSDALVEIMRQEGETNSMKSKEAEQVPKLAAELLSLLED